MDLSMTSKNLSTQFRTALRQANQYIRSSRLDSVDGGESCFHVLLSIRVALGFVIIAVSAMDKSK